MMPFCPDCRNYFSTPPGEEQDHECPRCRIYGRRVGDIQREMADGAARQLHRIARCALCGRVEEEDEE